MCSIYRKQNSSVQQSFFSISCAILGSVEVVVLLSWYPGHGSQGSSNCPSMSKSHKTDGCKKSRIHAAWADKSKLHCCALLRESLDHTLKRDFLWEQPLAKGHWGSWNLHSVTLEWDHRHNKWISFQKKSRRKQTLDD